MVPPTVIYNILGQARSFTYTGQIHQRSTVDRLDPNLLLYYITQDQPTLPGDLISESTYPKSPFPNHPSTRNRRRQNAERAAFRGGFVSDVAHGTCEGGAGGSAAPARVHEAGARSGGGTARVDVRRRELSMNQLRLTLSTWYRTYIYIFNPGKPVLDHVDHTASTPVT